MSTCIQVGVRAWTIIPNQQIMPNHTKHTSLQPIVCPLQHSNRLVLSGWHRLLQAGLGAM